MLDDPDSSYLSDICLMLRSHGEQLWLSTKILPLVEKLEDPAHIDEDAAGASMSYLEVLWIDAGRRARETEAAFAELLADGVDRDEQFLRQTQRYHASVRGLRAETAERVGRLTGLATPRPGRATHRSPAAQPRARRTLAPRSRRITGERTAG